MDMIRRTVLKGAGATGMLAGLLAAGVLKPTLAYANDWNKAAFEAKELDAALKALGAEGATEHKDLVMKAPEIAENGAVVPIDVACTLPNTSSIAILVLKNPSPSPPSSSSPMAPWPMSPSASRSPRPPSSAPSPRPMARSIRPRRKSRSLSAAAAADPTPFLREEDSTWQIR